MHRLRGEGRWQLKIDARTPIWVVNDPLGPHSTLPDVCFETDLAGLRLQFAGGLSMDQRPVLFTTEEEAHEEALNRLLVWRVARQIRVDRRLPEGEVVRVTLHGQDGTVLFEGEVRQLGTPRPAPTPLRPSLAGGLSGWVKLCHG